MCIPNCVICLPFELSRQVFLAQRKLFLIARILCTGCLILSGCFDSDSKWFSSPDRSRSEESNKLNPEQLAYQASVTGTIFWLEVADTPELSARGLMHRKSLRPDHGMIFFFDPPRRVSFWMKNTLIPLSVAFLDESGVILEILPLQPLSERIVFSSSDRVRYAIEMEQGWFDLKGIRVGDKVDLSQVPLPKPSRFIKSP